MRGGPLVVVGDTLLDVDLDGAASRLAPDAPVPVVDCRTERHRAGGAGLAAVLAAAMTGGEVVLITALGQDRQSEQLRAILHQRVRVIALPLQGGTPSKVRVRAGGQPLVRLDAGDGRLAPGPLPPAARQALAVAGAVLVADYGRGVAAHPALAAALTRLRRDVPVVWDPHPCGPAPVRGVRLVTPNRAEAGGLAAALGRAGPADVRPDAGPAGTASSALAQAARDAAELARAWGAAVAVTLGEGGALLSVGEATPVVVPAGPGVQQASDTCGAGDCFAAAAALALRDGALLSEAVEAAVRAATGFVRAGAASAAPGITVPASAAVPARPVPGAPRPGGAGGPRGRLGCGRPGAGRGGTVVATGGCFDLLHAGHVEILREARRLGDCLVVCLNSDSSVSALKGPGRPLVGAADRARVLLGLDSVDAVLVFDEPTPSAVLDRLRPDVWVKGGDYAHGELAEAAVVRRHGGQVVLLPYVGRHSTSKIVAAARGEQL